MLPWFEIGRLAVCTSRDWAAAKFVKYERRTLRIRPVRYDLRFSRRGQEIRRLKT